MDLMIAPANLHEIELIVNRYFYALWAPLLTYNTVCVSYGITSLYSPVPGLSIVPIDVHGAVVATRQDISKATVVHAYAGVYKSDATRRFYIPFMPASSSVDGVLKTDWQERVLTRLRGLILGADGGRGGVGPRLIVWQNPQPSDRWRTGHPARWAEVQQLILMTYTDHAPVGF